MKRSSPLLALAIACLAPLASAQQGAGQAGGTPKPEAAPPPQQQPPAQPEQPAGPKKASLAVMPFTFGTETLEQRGDEVRLAIRQFETSAFTNKFITALVNTRKFDVVERSRIDTLINEMQLGESGLLDRNRAAKAGQTLGADYFLTGEISVFTITVEWRPIPNTSRFSRTVTSLIIVDMRIIDTRTSRVVAAEKGEVRNVTRSMHDRQMVTEFPPDMIDALQRELCDTLTIKTIDGVYPIKIIGFAGGQCSLNRGAGGGLEVGQVLEVYSEGEEMLDPDTGESLGCEEIKIGQLRVTEILPRFSKAVPMGDGNLAMPNGAICRKVQAPAEAPTAPQAPRGPRW